MDFWDLSDFDWSSFGSGLDYTPPPDVQAALDMPLPVYDPGFYLMGGGGAADLSNYAVNAGGGTPTIVMDPSAAGQGWEGAMSSGVSLLPGDRAAMTPVTSAAGTPDERTFGERVTGSLKDAGAKIGESVVKNPFQALVGLTGAGLMAGGLYSSAGAGKVTAPKRTAELTPQEQALFSRASASLPNDPNWQTQKAQMRQAALEKVRRDMGPGGEYSTPGKAYLESIENQINAVETQRATQDISIAGNAFRNLSDVANTQYRTNTELALQNAQMANQRGSDMARLGGTLLGTSVWPYMLASARA